MKKIISMLMALIMLMMSVVQAGPVYARNLDDELVAKDGSFELVIDGEIYLYEISYTVDERIVTIKDSEGNVLDRVHKKENSDSVYVESLDKDVEVMNSFDGEVLSSDSNSLMRKSSDYIWGSTSLSLKTLCTSVGVAITLYSLIGIIIAAMEGAAVITTTILKSGLKEAASLSLAIGAILPDRGITFHYKAYKTRRCRGSDCYTGYLDLDF